MVIKVTFLPKKIWTKFLICFASTTFIFQESGAQNVQLKKPIDAEIRKELVKLVEDKVIGIESNIEYNISSIYTAPNLDIIRDEKPYDDEYLSSQLEAIKKDSTEHIYHLGLASYYIFHEDQPAATEHSRIALRKLERKKKNFKGSSSFYSYRGLIKIFLSDSTAQEDFDKSISINPTDSIATYFYLHHLMGKGDFGKAKAHAMMALNKDDHYQEDIYAIFAALEITKQFIDAREKLSTEEFINKITQQEFDTFFDFTLIDQYTKKFNKNKNIQLLREMTDLMAITIKVISFYDYKNDVMEWTLTPKELARLAEMRRIFVNNELKISEYSTYKHLGLIDLFLKDYKSADMYLNKAISFFPENGGGSVFTCADTYSYVWFIKYFIDKDVDAQRKLLFQKIEKKPGRKLNPDDYITLAKLALKEGDMTEAEKWNNEAYRMNNEDSRALSLKSHFFFKKDIYSLCKSNLEKAYNSSADIDKSTLLIQIAVYQLCKDEISFAYDNLQMAKLLYNGDCMVCDIIEKNYLEITK